MFDLGQQEAKVYQSSCLLLCRKIPKRILFLNFHTLSYSLFLWLLNSVTNLLSILQLKLLKLISWHALVEQLADYRSLGAASRLKSPCLFWLQGCHRNHKLWLRINSLWLLNFSMLISFESLKPCLPTRDPQNMPIWFKRVLKMNLCAKPESISIFGM